MCIRDRCDKITVLRDGGLVGEYAIKDLPRVQLVSKMLGKELDDLSDIKGEQLQIAWGAQIRSYVFMPYTMVKDHRTGYEMGNIGAVMDGDLDGFINAYLKALSLGEIEK